MNTSRLMGSTLALLALAASGVASAVTADASYWVGPGLGIAVPDEDPTGITNTISIADSATIERIAVVVALDHTWVGDLTFTLTGPDGTSITLLDRPGTTDPTTDLGDSSNSSIEHHLIFGDYSPISSENMGGGGCTSTDSVIGVDCVRWFAPETSLDATYAGSNILGDWTLSIVDGAAQDLGVLDSWLVAFQLEPTQPIPVPAAVWLFASGLVALGARRRRRA